MRTSSRFCRRATRSKWPVKPFLITTLHYKNVKPLFKTLPFPWSNASPTLRRIHFVRYPYWGIFFFPGVRKGRRATQELSQVAARILDNYRSKAERKPEKMIDLMIHDDLSASGDERISDIVLYLAGGFDSTSYVSVWAFLLLAKNPPAQAAFRKVLQTTRDVGACDKLKHVVRETHRLYPKGADVLMPYFLMGRNENVFEQANDFCPSRWKKNPTANQLQAVMPFSAGKRNCQGQALARKELEAMNSWLAGLQPFSDYLSNYFFNV